jgi:hypothetical protein
MVFNVPTNPTITNGGRLQGIELMVGRRNSVPAPAPQPVTDKVVQLRIGTALGATSQNKADARPYAAMTSGFEFFVYGGQTDTWGFPANVDTLSDIASYIALEFQAQVPTCCTGSKLHFDCAQIRIYWSNVATTQQPTPLPPTPQPTPSPTPAPTPVPTTTTTRSPTPTSTTSTATVRPTTSTSTTTTTTTTSSAGGTTQSTSPTASTTSTSSTNPTTSSFNEIVECNSFDKQCNACISRDCRFCDGSCTDAPACATGTVIDVGADGTCPVTNDTSSVVATPAIVAQSSSPAITDELDIWPWVGLGIGLCVLLMIIVIVVVVVRRRKQTRSETNFGRDLDDHNLADMGGTTATAFDAIINPHSAPRTNEYASVSQAFAMQSGSSLPRSSTYGSPMAAVTPSSSQYGGADFLDTPPPADNNGGTVASGSVVYGLIQ